MGTREVYDYEQQKWVPYVSDPDKWYQHLLDMRDGLVEPDYIGRYIVGSGEKHRRLKEMEAKQIEKQRQKVKPLYLRDTVKTSSDRSKRISCNTMVPFDLYNRIYYLDALRDAQREDRLKMLRDITVGQLACIGEVARRIYHQTYPLLAQDVTYFDDRSLVLRSLFSALASFRRKKAVLIRYHRMMLRLLRPYYLYATIQDQIRSQRES